MMDVDAGSGDRIALAVLAQYRMATTEQMHLILNPQVRIAQTRRRLAKLPAEGLVDRITLPQRGRTRVWLPTRYGVQVACEWPELRGRRPSKTLSDRTAVRLRVGHALTVTETALAFLQDARRRGELCRPLDWIPEVYHPIGSGEAVIPDAVLFYRRGREGGEGAMLRAFVEVDRATMGPERLAAKLHSYSPPPPLRARTRTGQTAPAGRPGTTAGGVEAALPALPAAAVRPGRHRPRGHQDPYQRPARGRRGPDAG
ncbi:replication-relaxation family protein [Streptomyces sp. NPDC001276]|uniref:replication-relaxation family protein n=1 Tax=Streptomyces sp. NPDC001276 TaxID=3364555 RepID=UPI0036863CCA